MAAAVVEVVLAAVEEELAAAVLDQVAEVSPAAAAVRRRRHEPLHRSLGRIRQRDRGRMLVVETSVAEMSVPGISRTSEPEWDRVLRRCRRLGRALERVRALDQAKELRIAPEQVRASPLDRVLARGQGSRIVPASPNRRRGCRDWAMAARGRDCRIKEPIDRKRSKVGAAI